MRLYQRKEESERGGEGNGEGGRRKGEKEYKTTNCNINKGFFLQIKGGNGYHWVKFTKRGSGKSAVSLSYLKDTEISNQHFKFSHPVTYPLGSNFSFYSTPPTTHSEAEQSTHKWDFLITHPHFPPMSLRGSLSGMNVKGYTQHAGLRTCSHIYSWLSLAATPWAFYTSKSNF